VAEVVSEDSAASPAPPAEESFFRKKKGDLIVNQRRFGLAYLVLAIGVGVAVGFGIVLIGRGSDHKAATGGAQSFRPTQSGELGAKEIARHVGVKYREADGSPLAAVVGERPNFQGQPLSFYLIRPHDAQDPHKDIAIFSVGNGIMYAMCGFGKNCATPTTETTKDALLLKREALELTLNTFKSDSAVDTVTTLLPPLPQGNVAMIFRRNDLAPWVHGPLSSLLSTPGTVKPGQVPTGEAQRIDTVSAGSLYVYDAVQGPDGNAYFRLDPIG
jgi:hypothetical protein